MSGNLLLLCLESCLPRKRAFSHPGQVAPIEEIQIATVVEGTFSLPPFLFVVVVFGSGTRD